MVMGTIIKAIKRRIPKGKYDAMLLSPKTKGQNMPLKNNRVKHISQLSVKKGIGKSLVVGFITLPFCFMLPFTLNLYKLFSRRIL
jgi:hypothetical protein